MCNCQKLKEIYNTADDGAEEIDEIDDAYFNKFIRKIRAVEAEKNMSNRRARRYLNKTKEYSTPDRDIEAINTSAAKWRPYNSSLSGVSVGGMLGNGFVDF